ncbi:hypothetical protein [Streptomyces parvus]|uniref:hypothetical protein n=1 Tax=Streptomyces parvus TaxID=66428 RepID=UPI002100FE3B|nr:hypothetical protein [Streptomyces parvus]MCQ1577241.1 hypothetical protein [Streptomyces parvus]
MTPIHPDSLLLATLINTHDQTNGNAPDSKGKIAGYDSSCLLGAGGHRAQLMVKGFGTLRKTLNPRQLEELHHILAAMWKDGFAVGACSQQPSARYNEDAAQSSCTECDHPRNVHQDAEDPVTPGQCMACLVDDAWHDFAPESHP